MSLFADIPVIVPDRKLEGNKKPGASETPRSYCSGQECGLLFQARTLARHVKQLPRTIGLLAGTMGK